MNAYELVVTINPSTSQEERDAIDTEIKGLLGEKSIKDRDDMGLVQFAYEMFQKKGLHQGFVTSYYLDTETASVRKVKKMLSYKKEVLRCVFFAMKETQKYMTLEKASEDVMSLVESDERTMKKKLTLFNDKKNEEYLVWKALPLLNKFVTRFGDIKPRKYTGITVSQQKKMRVAVQRARELGFMAYIK